MNKCVHIIGQAWIMNPEEGSAWINRHIRGNSQQPQVDDWNYVFQYCPCCGEKLLPPVGVEILEVDM